jgi:BCD family chlorophyll transporter-like MFS transporter
MVGIGLHTVQTAGLALATDLAPEESRPKVVGLMYVMLLVGTIVSAFAFGAFLREFSPARLVQVIQACAAITLVLNTVALWKQETRRPARLYPRGPDPSFTEAWRTFIAGDGARHRLAAIGLGTMAFGMQDVLLEPYGGHVLGMSVGETTWLTATFATGGLIGFALASRVLNRGFDPARMAALGAIAGVPGFALAIGAAALPSVAVFAFGVFLIGFGGGLFSHGTLTLTMNRAPRDQAGLALGAWGAVQATAAGIALAAGGQRPGRAKGFRGLAGTRGDRLCFCLWHRDRAAAGNAGCAGSADRQPATSVGAVVVVAGCQGLMPLARPAVPTRN